MMREYLTTQRERVRFALRTLRRAPAFTTAAVGLLALGIGTTTAIFSVASTVLVRRLPVRDQDRVISLWATAPGAQTEVSTSVDRLERFRHATRTLAGVAGFAHYGSNMVPLRDKASPLYARESLVTGNFFDVLGTKPVVGRLLRPEDDVVGAAPVLVISESFWRRTFGADSNIAGRRLEILNREVTAIVVGVVPAGLDYPSGTDYWFPLAPAKYPAVDLIARLGPGATPRTAQTEFAAFIENDTRDFPNDLSARSLRAGGTEMHSFADVVVGPARQPLVILSIAVAGLLLIACVNIGSLFLIRATMRARELAIRRAVGASSRQIFVQLSTEIVALAVAGGAVGAAIAAGLLRIVVAVAPAGVPRLDQLGLSPGAFVLATAVSVVSLFVAGVVPALMYGESVGMTLRVIVETPGRRTLRSVLVASQIALALILLAFAGLLARSVAKLQGLDPGYESSHLSIVQITAPFHKYRTRREFDDAFDGARRQLHAVPGVTAVSPVLAWPFLGPNIFSARIEARDRTGSSGDAPYVSWDAVGSEFSNAMDSPIVRGRGIGDEDREDAPRVAVVTQDLAVRFWPREDPIGKQLRFAGVSNDTAWRTVVGVMRPFNYRMLQSPTPTVLFSYRQEFQQGIFVLRSSRDLSTILPALRRAASTDDHDVVLWRAQTMEEMRGGPLARPRLQAFLLTTFAGIALVLAAVGLYGVTAYLIRQQTREFGIRMALGATGGHVMSIAFGGALRVAAMGTVVGLAISLFATRLVSTQLFQVRANDPIALIAAAAVLIVVTLGAAVVPARRATQIDPVRALRAE